MQNDHVLTVCQQPLLRVGLRQVLTTEAGLHVCGEAGTASAALDLLSQVQPGLIIVVTGSVLGDGLALLKDLRRAQPRTPILVIGRAGDVETVQRALRAGATGYVTSSDSLPELLLAVASVRTGSLHVSREAAAGLLVPIKGRKEAKATNGTAALSDREVEVYHLIGQGLGSKTIASQLHISIKTVETHRQRMKDKLHLHSGSELNQHAVRTKLQAVMRGVGG